MMENFFEKLLDKSSAMRALRKSASKAIILGLLDALQAPGNAAELDTGELEASPQDAKEGATPSGRAVPLPRPQLIGLPAKDDEPDRPGVPPKRVRKKSAHGPQVQGTHDANGEAQAEPPPDTNSKGGEGA